MKNITRIIKNAVYAYKEAWRISKIICLSSIIYKLIFDIALPYGLIYITKNIIDVITSGINNSTIILLILVSVIGLLTVNIINKTSMWYYNIILNKLKQNIKIKNENDIINKISNIEYEYFESPSYYNFINQLGTEISGNVLSFYEEINSIFSTIIHLGIIMYYVITYNSVFMLIHGLLQIPFMLIYLYIEQYKYNQSVAENPVRRKLKYLNNFLFNKNTVMETKLYQSLPFINQQRTELFNDLKSNHQKANFMETIANIWNEIYWLVLEAVMFLIYGMKVINRLITIGDFYFIQGIIEKFTGVISSTTSGITNFNYLSLKIDEYKAFMDMKEERQDCGNVINTRESCDIEIRNLSFKYPESDKYVLKNINLHIKPGQKIAVVGHNGAGKTTLSRIILGLFNQYEGEIYLNNREYKTINNKDIYDTFSTVMQDYYKYPFTLKDNITISDHNKNYHEQFVDELMKKVDAEKIIHHLPNKYDTYINKTMDENGTDLSEGQWQKIMLVRALYSDKNNIIFDEPTASLDPIAEEVFYKNVFDEAKDKTLIIITHRLACTINSDMIIVINDGEIVEMGNHKELMSAKNHYYNMFTVQAEGYKLSNEVK